MVFYLNNRQSADAFAGMEKFGEKEVVAWRAKASPRDKLYLRCLLDSSVEKVNTWLER